MKKVVIIGAGVAGISAAIKLIKAGFDVDIYESKNSPGGRVYSFRDNISGELIDNGQHLLSGAYSSFLGILEELGTSQYCKKQESLQVFFSEPGKVIKYLNTSIFNGLFGTIYGFLKFDGLSAFSKLLLIKFIISIKFKSGIKDNTNCLDFLVKHNQNDELIVKFWRPLILAAMNCSPAKAPANLLINILKEAFFADSSVSRLIIPKADLSVLLNPVTDWINRNHGKISYTQRVYEIVIDNGKAIGIKTNSGEFIQGDFIISAVQPDTLFGIMPDSVKNEFEYLTKFNYSRIINIYYWLDKHPESPDFVSLLNTESQWMFNRSNFTIRDKEISEQFPGLINITISDANNSNLNAEDLAKHCWSELTSCLPQFKQCKVLRSKVINDSKATVELTTESEELRPEALTKINGLLLSGDWTNTGLPATIEGASRSGEEAANIIIRSQL